MVPRAAKKGGRAPRRTAAEASPRCSLLPPPLLPGMRVAQRNVWISLKQLASLNQPVFLKPGQFRELS